MATAPYIRLRKTTKGLYRIFPRTHLMGIIVNEFNLDEVLHRIFIDEQTFIVGYKTMSGARKKILSLITN